jgi:hypothetical protein
MMLWNIKNPLIMSVAAAMACILQVIGLIRYIGRLPEDYIGISLFSITAIIFAIVSIGFFMQWRKQVSGK